MYEMSEGQRNTLIYILDHLTVTGPNQGGMLNNAARIVMSLKQKPEVKEESNKIKEDK